MKYFFSVLKFCSSSYYVLDVAVAVPNPTEVSNIVLESILCTILVFTELPPSSVQINLSPIFKSV